MKKFVKLPFYVEKNNELLYLGKEKICKLSSDEELKKSMLINEGALLERDDIDNEKETILVLEPHPDDFALSALGYVLNRYNAIVLNIFSKMNIDSFTWKDNIKIEEEEYEKLRLQESKFAVEEILQQKFITLKEESTRITSKNKEVIQREIIQEASEILNKNANIQIMLIPMGIGNHPDHLIVQEAILKLYKENNSKKLILYPEYPYARCKKDYNDRLEEMKERYELSKITVNVEEILEIWANAISVYRSQFDDINRSQMLAIIREDCRAVAKENKKEKLSLVYYEVKGIKK